jgi:alpha-tubulin suppressor-like RCC1 family protein
MSNQTGFKITDATAGWNRADFDDVFVRKDCFLEGGLWLWGCGVFGPLGTNSTTSQSSPVQTVSGGTNWRTVSAGSAHTGAIKTDGTLWMWGAGSVGRLGNNSTNPQSSPIQTVSGGNDWRSVSAKDCQVVATKTDGTLWTWGLNASGQLGNNATTDQSSPVQTISGGTNWRMVSAGISNMAAIKTDGTLWLWGSGFCGRLGNNATTDQSSPVQTISGGTNWRTVSAGCNHTTAIKTDGSLWTWGLGSSGQLGTNSFTDRSSPVQTISGGTNWRSVSAGGANTTAIKTDGSLWLWGTGVFGRLGNNSAMFLSSPVQTVSGGTNWRSVSAGNGGDTTAIKTDGSLWVWGRNAGGQLGINSIIDQSSPVQIVSGGTAWRMVSAGNGHNTAIREDCW